MNNDFKKISPDSNDANDLRLMELNNALFENEDLSDITPNDFENDAAEGLKQIEENKIPKLVAQINSNLTNQLKNKKRLLPKIPDQTMVIITIVTLLILIIVTFFVIRRML